MRKYLKALMFHNKSLTFNQKILLASHVFLSLSISDGLLTLWGLKLNVIEEVNPIMKLIISKSPTEFMAIKLLLPILVGVFCWMVKDKARKLVIFILGFVISIYTLLIMLHVYWIMVI